MTQLQCDISENLAARLQRKAEALNLSVSTYLAQLIQKELSTDDELAKENGWPEGYFDLFGSGKDDPIERPDQREYPVKEITL